MDFSKLADFCDRLQDEESRVLFSLKLDMLLGKRGYADFLDTLLRLDYSWNMTDKFEASGMMVGT